MRKIIEGQDYVVREIPFPNNGADGAIVSSADGVATIVINMNVCPARKLKAYLHELRHLANDDLYSDLPVKEIEENASTEDI